MSQPTYVPGPFAIGTLIAASATNLTCLTYQTALGTSGVLECSLVARAATAAGGVAIGDTYTQTWDVAYTNVGGTVTLGVTTPAGSNVPTLFADETNAALVNVSVQPHVPGGGIITFSVRNVSGVTLHCQIVVRDNITS